MESIIGGASDDGCKAERNHHLDTVCKHSQRAKRSEFKNADNARVARQVFSRDVENTRHVVDRSESDKTGFRSPTRNQGAAAPYARHVGGQQTGAADTDTDNYLCTVSQSQA